MSQNKRARTSGASSSRHPLGLTDPEHITRYEKLKDRLVRPTKFVCDTTLAQLLVKEDIDWLFSRLDMATFIRLNHPTHVDLTKEFLCTMELDTRPVNVTNGSRLSFRLKGREYSLTIAEINTMFGFTPTDIAHYNESKYTERLGFWGEMTGSVPYRPTGSISKFIRNPIMRIAHKVLACTLFGRVDLHTVRVVELLFLEYAFHNKELNVGAFLANHLVHVSRGAQDIVVGGIVTHIAIGLGVSLLSRGGIACASMGYSSLRYMKILHKDGNEYFWLHPDGRQLTISDFPWVTIRNANNLAGNWPRRDLDPQPEDVEPVNVVPLSPSNALYLSYHSSPHEGTSQGGFDEGQPGPSSSHYSSHSFDFSHMQSTLDVVLQNQLDMQEEMRRNHAEMMRHVTRWNYGPYPPPPP